VGEPRVATAGTPTVPVCNVCGEDAVMTGMRGRQFIALCAVHLPQFDAELADLYAAMIDIKRAARRCRDGRAN
jgi:hypothetical protein